MTNTIADGRLETDRLTLRRFSLADADLMLAIWNDPEFIRFVADRRLRTIEAAATAMRDGLLTLYEQYTYGPLCVVEKESGAKIGICGLFRREGLACPDLGFALLPAFRGKGLAVEAAAAVVDDARISLRLPSLVAIVSPQNTASIRLLETLGFSFNRRIKMPGDDQMIYLYSIDLGREEKDE